MKSSGQIWCGWRRAAQCLQPELSLANQRTFHAISSKSLCQRLASVSVFIVWYTVLLHRWEDGLHLNIKNTFQTLYSYEDLLLFPSYRQGFVWWFFSHWALQPTSRTKSLISSVWQELELIFRLFTWSLSTCRFIIETFPVKLFKVHKHNFDENDL